ncbi:MAG: DUF6076 domain-containing protein [Bacilli bacterium]|nr:DUF6076 domain-containing protein [Bacilli bacterium]MDD4718604.1 DUF6076 domain-containing protein [Bacilli bacterium]
MYNLIIRNDDFNIKIVDVENKKERYINASYDIFDFQDKDSKYIINLFISMCENLFEGKYNNDYVIFFFTTMILAEDFPLKKFLQPKVFQNADKILKQLPRNLEFSKILDEQYARKFKKDFNKLFNRQKADTITTYYCENECEIVASCLLHFIKLGKPIIKCSHCGKYFIPVNRNDTKYCDRLNNNNKTCKEINMYNKQIESIRDVEKKLYKSVYNTIRNRNSEELIKFTSDAKMWKENLKNRSVTKEDYINWLNSHYHRKKG